MSVSLATEIKIGNTEIGIELKQGSIVNHLNSAKC